MGWLARFVGWATLFTILGSLVMAPYQRTLAALVAGLFGAFGYQVEFGEVAVAAPLDLGIYAAMCLASRRSPATRRRRAIALGIPLLVLGEVIVIGLVIAVYLGAQGDAEAIRRGTRMTGYLIESIPWINAAALWLAFLGTNELPSAAGQTAAARSARSDKFEGASGSRAPTNQRAS